jgi:hypothetical protein
VGRVSSYAIDPKTHELSLINQVQSLGNEPTHSSLSADASHLFVSNYSVAEDPGGTLAVLPVSADGALKPVVQMSSHPASRVNPERQMSSHVHSTVSSPDGRYVFSNDLGADRSLPIASIPRPTRPALDPGQPCIRPVACRQRATASAVQRRWQTCVADHGDECAGGGVRLPGRLAEQTQMVDLAAGQPVSDKAAAALHASADGKFLTSATVAPPISCLYSPSTLQPATSRNCSVAP